VGARGAPPGSFKPGERIWRLLNNLLFVLQTNDSVDHHPKGFSLFQRNEPFENDQAVQLVEIPTNYESWNQTLNFMAGLGDKNSTAKNQEITDRGVECRSEHINHA